MEESSPMDNVEKLYKNFGVLADAKDKIGEHESEYLEILAAIKGSTNEKRLASQFITRFFRHFPHLADRAIDAQLDLCEDDDIAIRKQAIKDLPSLCKDSSERLLKIADVLAQLLQADDATELNCVHQSLMTLFKLDAKGTLHGLFSQILNGEEVVRDRAIKFLVTKIKTLGETTLTKEVEETVLEETRKVLQDVNGAEFEMFMSILSNLKMSRFVSGQRVLVEITVEQAELEKPFEFTDPDNIYKLMQCIKQAQPFLSSQVPSTRFTDYTIQQVLPVLAKIPVSPDGVDLRLEILKLLAEMSTYAIDLSEDKDKLQIVFEKLLEYMPLPPSDENSENALPQDDPKLEFSYVECLMYTFHQLGKRCPEFLTDESNSDCLKDFKLRLQYLARGIQGYIKKLRESLQGKKAEDLKTDENKIKVVALKTTSNINVLIRDLFHNPPSYKSTITLSWKPPVTKSMGFVSSNLSSAPITQTTEEKGTKRHTPITFNDGSGVQIKKLNIGSQPKGPREIYTPPSGKYSANVKSFKPGLRGRGGRGRGFGGRGWGNRGFLSF